MPRLSRGLRNRSCRRRERSTPKVLEAIGRHLGVPDRVLDVLVPEVVLQRPRVVAIIGELEPTGMAQHVRVDREWHLGSLTDALDEAVEADGTDWPTALGNEHISLSRVIAPELPKRSDAVNVQAALGQLNLLPLQVAHLGGPQTVAIGDQDHGRVAMPVATMLAGVVHQPLDFALGEIASFNCQVYDVWSALLGSRFHRGKSSFSTSSD